MNDGTEKIHRSPDKKRRGQEVVKNAKKVKTIKDTVTAVHLHNEKGCNSDHKLLFVTFKS